MIESLEISGYRGFTKFTMNALGTVNLLVGTNNSGKTSVLEALFLLASAGDPGAIWRLMGRRGERLSEERVPRHGPDPEIDICHMFNGHEIVPGSKFTLSAKNQTPERSLTFSIGEPTGKERQELFGEEGAARSRLVFHVKGSPNVSRTIPLTRRLGLSVDAMDVPRRVRSKTDQQMQAQYISAESMTADELVSMWDKIALTPDEDLAVSALKFLDSKIERLASISSFRNYYGFSTRGGFILKREGSSNPIPIGSMGDGMWRVLAMAIAITQCKGGVLLVDEIDTGLHYSVMSDMWKLIFDAAKRNEVQIFATTHSGDCVNSLASICVSNDKRVTIQRVENNRTASVPFSESEILVSSKRGIEMR